MSPKQTYPRRLCTPVTTPFSIHRVILVTAGLAFPIGAAAAETYDLGARGITVLPAVQYSIGKRFTDNTQSPATFPTAGAAVAAWVAKAKTAQNPRITGGKVDAPTSVSTLNGNPTSYPFTVFYTAEDGSPQSVQYSEVALGLSCLAVGGPWSLVTTPISTGVAEVACVKYEPRKDPVGRAKSPTPGRVKIPHLLTV